MGIKNVIMLNSAVNCRRLVPESHYHSLYKGYIPKGVTIDLAFVSNNQILEWRQSQMILAITDEIIPINFDKFNKNKYVITFQIKHLLIKVVFYESDSQTFYEDKGCIRLHPDFGLLKGDIVYDNINKFATQGVIHENK